MRVVNSFQFASFLKVVSFAKAVNRFASKAAVISGVMLLRRVFASSDASRSAGVIALVANLCLATKERVFVPCVFGAANAACRRAAYSVDEPRIECQPIGLDPGALPRE